MSLGPTFSKDELWGAVKRKDSVAPKQMMELVKSLKVQRKAAILVHNYVEGPVQEAADYVGDSLKLAQYALTLKEPVILFCGVHFMAETAAMLCPDKQVIVPDPEAGCALADTVVASQIRHWKAAHPDGVVLAYINTSAAVKAECDYCCTSANGEQIVAAIPEDREILFIPDYYLGTYLKRKTGRKIHIWRGYCPAHAAIDPEGIERLQEANPEAEFLMHPECGCLTKQMHLADKILSTDGMIRYAHESEARSFIVATENGLLYRMRKENPSKTFLPAAELAGCAFMERTTLEKVARSLATMQHPVTVDPALAERALLPLKRMLEITRKAQQTAQPPADDDETLTAGTIALWDDPVLEVANDIR